MIIIRFYRVRVLCVVLCLGVLFELFSLFIFYNRFYSYFIVKGVEG